MPPSPRPIRTAIIGYGESGRLSHAYGLQANPAFEIVAVCDSSPQNRDRAERELGCKTYPDHPALLASEALDLASIVTRSDTHCAIACDCLGAGVDTVITKPWALDATEAETMLRAVEASGRQLFPWIPMYWSDDFRLVRKLLREDSIGDVFLIRRYYTDFRRRSDWQTERQYGGGYLLNWGTHIVQPILGLAGSRLHRVFGQLQQTINGGDADDNFLAVLEFADGVRGIAEFTQSLSPLPGFLVQGTRGTIHSDGRTVTLERQDPADPATRRKETFAVEGKAFGDEAEIYRDIARSLRENVPFPTPPELALEGTRALDAIRLSHETGTIVTLAP